LFQVWKVERTLDNCKYHRDRYTLEKSRPKMFLVAY
jgi:hypothetical protein